jgi:hypothetical protein
MSLLTPSPVWNRHHSIDRALERYYDLLLRFPKTAKTVRSGDINSRVAPKIEFQEGHVFSKVSDTPFDRQPLSLEAEAEYEEFRNLVGAILSLMEQIFHSSRDKSTTGRELTDVMFALREHGDKAISRIVGENWRSLWVGVTEYAFSDNELRDKVVALVEQNSLADAGFRKLTGMENTNA